MASKLSKSLLRRKQKVASDVLARLGLTTIAIPNTCSVKLNQFSVSVCPDMLIWLGSSVYASMKVVHRYVSLTLSCVFLSLMYCNVE